MPSDGLQDELAVVLPEHHGLFEQPQQLSGRSGIAALLGHPPDQGNLPRDPLLTGGEMPICQDQVFAFALEVVHGDTPGRAGGSARLSQSLAPTGSNLPVMEPFYTLWGGER
ncbi:hypothetical protein [Microvirga sp. KLBC 81]|uniref:hypothetical protein n=1 Tax=Microvirga sp. KLBC 81 TaxID=1862707 RepID=UPI0014024054|nr:hypothetical protein [Microvirga sp. KLBC 81]